MRRTLTGIPWFEKELVLMMRKDSINRYIVFGSAVYFDAGSQKPEVVSQNAEVGSRKSEVIRYADNLFYPMKVVLYCLYFSSKPFTFIVKISY